MADIIRRFVSRLVATGAERFLEQAGLDIDVAGLSARRRTKAVVDAVHDAGDEARGRLEAVAGHIMVLADQTDHAERALRIVCEDRSELLDILETERSLEERILEVSLLEPRILDQARNLALTYHWKEGRRYCARFSVGNPAPIYEDVNLGVEAVRQLVQSLQGGRKAVAETFSYYEPNSATEGDVGARNLISHTAIYLETPAKALLEFRSGASVVFPVVRREAKEMAVEYNLTTGEIEVVGRGVGGSKVFREVAETFCTHVLAGGELTEIKHEEWPLELFLSDQPPQISPPPGFARVRVSGLLLRSQRTNGGRATFVAGFDGTVYERMKELGVKISPGSSEWASEVTLALATMPEGENEDERDIRVVLRWPNTVSFDGAGIPERRVIREWLKTTAFTALVNGNP